MMKTMKKTFKAFTLLELMVVIAIVAVLAGLLIPKATSYIKKAQMAADLENARVIYEAVSMIVLTNDAAAEGFYPQSKYKLPVTVNQNRAKSDGYESYNICPVARAYGNTQITHKNNDWGWTATEDANRRKAFINSLNNFEGFGNKKGQVYVKMSCRIHKNPKSAKQNGSSWRSGTDDYITDKWLICVRRDDSMATEIWAGNSNGVNANGPMYRLWPDPDEEYTGGRESGSSGGGSLKS